MYLPQLTASQDMELYRVFDSLVFSDTTADRLETGMHTVGELDPQQTQTLMLLVSLCLPPRVSIYTEKILKQLLYKMHPSILFVPQAPYCCRLEGLFQWDRSFACSRTWRTRRQCPATGWTSKPSSQKSTSPQEAIIKKAGKHKDPELF